MIQVLLFFYLIIIDLTSEKHAELDKLDIVQDLESGLINYIAFLHRPIFCIFLILATSKSQLCIKMSSSMQRSIQKYMELTRDRNAGTQIEEHMQVLTSSLY